MVYTFFRFLFWVYFSLFYSLRIAGRNNILPRGAFLIAANHSSYFDPILIGVSTGRFLNYLARDTLFRKKCFGWIMRNVRAIPLKRRGSDFGAIRTSIDLLKRGRPLVIFPEGTRTVDGRLKEGHRGIGFLVAKAGVPVIPAYIGGAREAFPKWAKKPKPHPIRVRFGKAVYFGDLFGDETKSGYDRISQEIMKGIADLKARYESETGR